MAFKRKVKRDSSPVGYAWEVRWEDSSGKERQKTFTIKADPVDAKDARGRTVKPRPIEKIEKAAEEAADRFRVEVELELQKGNTTTPMTGRSQRFHEVAELMQTANAHTWKPKTARDTKSAFQQHIYPAFGDRRVNGQ